MPDEQFQTLSTLTPAVAVAVVFAYVILKKDKQYSEATKSLNQQHAEALQTLNAENLASHKEKTMAFLQEVTQEREMVKHLVTVHAASLEKFATTQQQLAKSIDLNSENVKLNTETTKDLREMLRKQ